MTEHELVTTFTTTSNKIEGNIDVKELKCHGKYTTAPIGANYCPKCGEEL